MPKSLQEYAKSKSNFISLVDGEKFSGIYKGFKFVEKESFGETKEYVRYLIQDLATERIMYLDSQSASLAKRMDKIKKETPITIKREGEGMKTQYLIEGVKESEEEETEEEIPVVEEPEFPSE